MKRDFSQPVSMNCNQQDYEKYLKLRLYDMGYEQKDLDEKNWHSYPILINNYQNIGNISNIEYESKNIYSRIFLPEFNPEKFIAIAAMSKTNQVYDGEIVIFIGISSPLYKHGELFRVVGDFAKPGSIGKEYNCMPFVGFGFDNYKYFRKATVNEILESTDPMFNWEPENLLYKKLSDSDQAEILSDLFGFNLKIKNESGVVLYDRKGNEFYNDPENHIFDFSTLHGIFTYAINRAKNQGYKDSQDKIKKILEID